MSRVIAYLVVSTLISAVWILLILTVKIIEMTVLTLPTSFLRSIAGIILYSLWGIMLIAAIKTLLHFISVKIAVRASKPSPKQS